MKGKKVAILVHCAGVTFAAVLVMVAAKLLMGTVPTSVIAASAIFYFGTVAFVTARVLKGTDEQAVKMANFIDRK